MLSKTLRFLANQIDHSAAIVISSQERRLLPVSEYVSRLIRPIHLDAENVPYMFRPAAFQSRVGNCFLVAAAKGAGVIFDKSLFFRTTLTLIRRLTSKYAKILHFLGGEQFQMLLQASSLHPPKFISS